jgi:cytosine/adenosine deaminase-related metal-dependent hydrolase
VTLNAAEVLRWQDRIGRLERGRVADIIGVSGNPLKNIGELERVRVAMKDGADRRKRSFSQQQLIKEPESGRMWSATNAANADCADFLS